MKHTTFEDTDSFKMIDGAHLEQIIALCKGTWETQICFLKELCVLGILNKKHKKQQQYKC